jgi:thiamine biosynthesis protein ThiC
VSTLGGSILAYLILKQLAAHAADLVNGVKGAREWDLEMAKARKKLDFYRVASNKSQGMRNQIQVDAEIREKAVTALKKMLDFS